MTNARKRYGKTPSERVEEPRRKRPARSGRRGREERESRVSTNSRAL